VSDPLADPRVRDWLGYGSYVDERRRILYVETPKCGCSSIKHLLRSLAGAGPLGFNPTLGESRLDMMIHDRGQSPLPPLTSFPDSSLDEIVNGEGWFRFAVVRDPAERFFSAWRDKIFLCEPGYERYLTETGKRYIEFEDFYRRVIEREDPETCNPHWRAQSALMLPDRIAYVRIYDIGELNQLPQDLTTHLAAIGQPAEVPVLGRTNEGLTIRADGFLTPEVLANLRYFYRADYARFDFPLSTIAWSEPRKAAELINSFTDAVFERNRAITAYSGWVRQALSQARLDAPG
jgi:hypothetical protein